MQLKRITLEDNEFNNGLKAIKMEGLGQVVALFGPNGAGKTRLLNSAKAYIDHCNNLVGKNGEKIEVKIKGDINRIIDRIKKRNTVLKNIEGSESEQAGRKIELESELIEWERQLKERKVSLEEHKKWRERALVAYETGPINPAVNVQLRFSTNRLKEVNEYPQVEIDQAIERVTNWDNGIAFSQSLIPFLHQLARAGFNAQNPNVDKEIIKPFLVLYNETQRIIESLMCMEFSYIQEKTDVLPALDKRPIRLKEISRGQKVLLIYAVCLIKSLMFQLNMGGVQTLDGAIVFIDEPEIYLHPSAVIGFIDSMREIVGKNGQIWLGTHAMCLLPHLKTEEIWTVYDGEVSSSRTDRGHKAIELLVGSEENVNKLYSFLQEPAKWAANKFAVESLLPAGQAEYRDRDPQMFQIAGVIDEKLKAGEEIYILDCGAGKGRLPMMIRELFVQEQQKLIHYIPVEPDESRHEEIKLAAGEMLEGSEVILRNEGIPGNYNGKIQVAVLCNVLHEIRPTKWFNELNLILKKLSDDGSIVICEDQHMKTGELPHELGFLVLNAEQLKDLFGLESNPVMYEPRQANYRGRLLCVEIPKKDSKVTKENVRLAVENLKGHLDTLIQGMRENGRERNETDGRKYAFYCNMFVNCEFALKEL